MKILIVRIGALGDVVHALPLVMALREKMPSAEIHWLAGPAASRFLQGHPAVDRIITIRRSIAGYRETLREIRGAYDLTIDTQGLLKSAFLARCAAARVIGRARGHAREWPAAWFYTDPVSPRRPHVIEQNLELLSPLGITPPSRIAYGLTLPEVKWELLDARPVLLNPGGGWWTKLWPAERYAELARRIAEELQLRVGVVWGPGEEALAETIVENSPAVRAPATDFLQLGACLARARLLVSGETGPLHLAAAVDCPTVALLGPTSAARNGPFGAGHRVIEPELRCRPCYARACADFRCMPLLAVDEVFSAVRGMIT